MISDLFQSMHQFAGYVKILCDFKGPIQIYCTLQKPGFIVTLQMNTLDTVNSRTALPINIK